MITSTRSHFLQKVRGMERGNQKPAYKGFNLTAFLVNGTMTVGAFSP